MTVFMHRQILGLVGRRGVDVDHADGDGLNNTRANLRIATRSLNSGNKKRQANKQSSKFKGVYPDCGGTWRAQIKDRVIGHFEYEADAAEAYNRAARSAFSEFAYCNDTADWQRIAPELPLDRPRHKRPRVMS